MFENCHYPGQNILYITSPNITAGTILRAGMQTQQQLNTSLSVSPHEFPVDMSTQQECNAPSGCPLTAISPSYNSQNHSSEHHSVFTLENNG